MLDKDGHSWELGGPVDGLSPDRDKTEDNKGTTNAALLVKMELYIMAQAHEAWVPSHV